MRTRVFFVLLVSFINPLFVQAAPELVIDEKVIVSHDSEDIWKRLRNFNNMHAWHPDVLNTTASNNNTPGSQRELDLGNDMSISEILLRHDDTHKILMYRLEKITTASMIRHNNLDLRVPALPVGHYISEMGVRPHASGGSEIYWYARLSRVYTGKGKAPVELDDTAAINALTHFFQRGLEALEQDTLTE